ncbi:MAG: N-acetylglucosamine kinase, partial [Flavobacteriales bacterium]|nr:N-acetylglucosamine kinase [Flavobacteriales bacterium]
LGAARALCGDKPGIAAILGTGSNSCLYDGEYIIKNIPSLGYVLGDEGSGAYIGKKFLGDVLSGKAPEELKTRFDKKFNLTKDKVLENIYMQPFPNRFLASFTRFLYQNLDIAYTKGLIRDCFQDFFDQRIKRYEGFGEMPVHFVGSVGFNFSAILREVAEDNQIEIGQILQAPIAALTLYHIHGKSE